ncbi:D-amino acid aminotransferase [Salipaludibacillus agaradhaerens]|uniref:D-amino acid aminotransferase n=1 Tax=Salipaludibacillus agaradhaerens TaxID=76935 RepID=A0A9Q4AZQ4_SALAG|nr:D-amino acid aminotransferase [Salipaludibacillus agaradhaerens]UJW58514.1 D-amino acid aminotransferase [Bacillus sp. A116_S68]MCR6095649.1 D-amino acid aminotransferase [Salipaludibacillus agaradhaerens]MCR6107460.1 D-amino acid aminotransferase [Salipaludibacillus agaradhaerens]MCR6114791.1 D-amino acid aminotransferase [Salipaludibacillus agaradhaerens]MCR6119489.1 D-amino acid aminotransferase [Salipaludibacillus agaradhaerens]
MAEIAFYKDSFIAIDAEVVPIQDRAHQFGDGIYEVIRVYNGKPFYLEAHLERLGNSAAAIQLSLPYTLDEIADICHEAVARSAIDEAEIYLQISRGIHSRQHHFPEPTSPVLALTVKEARLVSFKKRMEGLRVLTTEDDRWKNCYIKSLNLLPNVLAKQKAKEHGCDEAIYHENDTVKEGSSSNIFVVKKGLLFTYPPLKGILHGVTRKIVLNLAGELDIETKEEPFSLDFLYEADEVFLSSTSLEIMPVKQVDNQLLPTERPITAKLQELFQKLK